MKRERKGKEKRGKGISTYLEMKEGQRQRIRDNTGSNRGRREHGQQAKPRGSTEGASEGTVAIWMARTENGTSDGRGRSQNTTEGQSALHKEKGREESRDGYTDLR